MTLQICCNKPDKDHIWSLLNTRYGGGPQTQNTCYQSYHIEGANHHACVIHPYDRFVIIYDTHDVRQSRTM